MRSSGFLLDAETDLLSAGSISEGRITKRPWLVERPIQRAAIQLLQMMGCYAVHTPNGSHLAGDKVARAKQSGALRRDGLRPGFPDLTVIDQREPRVGFIEVKREGRIKLDPDQEWWRDELQRIGMPWALVNSPDGAAAVLREWGWR